ASIPRHGLERGSHNYCRPHGGSRWGVGVLLKHGVSEIVRRSDVQQLHCTHLASAAALPMVSRFAFAQAYAWTLVQLASILLLVHHPLPRGTARPWGRVAFPWGRCGASWSLSNRNSLSGGGCIRQFTPRSP